MGPWANPTGQHDSISVLILPASPQNLVAQGSDPALASSILDVIWFWWTVGTGASWSITSAVARMGSLRIRQPALQGGLLWQKKDIDGGSVIWKHQGCLMLTFLWHRAKGRVKIALKVWSLPHVNCIPRGRKRSYKLAEEPLVWCGDTIHAELPGLGGWNGVPNSGIQTFGCSRGRKSSSTLGIRIPWPCEDFQDAPGCCVKDGLGQRWDQEMEQDPKDNVHMEDWGCRQQRRRIPCLEHTESMGMSHARGGWD